ncbi:hypothetical protein GCM10007079_13430 [Nocardiopsis terrae]|uniref:Uncharacterized protein n=1 Tax=Nocardiopsis terrae TaxID=372655 RepID=A0ABR9HBQ0_9ACTN|nr:hypothetical protein [Nocardiopsis terrae]GHC76783.1 hypothetical protein GCM10007079_13430 [Nocardiopsis terrae]
MGVRHADYNFAEARRGPPPDTFDRTPARPAHHRLRTLPGTGPGALHPFADPWFARAQ